jgi:hypothetical protein
MNIKQKNKKQNCVIMGFTSFTLLSGVLCILKVTFEGLVMEAEKRKKSNTRNSIIRKETQKKGVGKIKRNTTTTCTFVIYLFV